MNHESFEKSDIGVAQQSAAVFSTDFASANHIQMRLVAQNLTVSTDNRSLVFDTKAPREFMPKASSRTKKSSRCMNILRT